MTISDLISKSLPLPAGTRIKTTNGGIPTGGTHELSEDQLRSANAVPNHLSDTEPFWINGWADLHQNLILPETEMIGASSIIALIYNAEIPCRIEWMYDGGFTWSLVNEKIYPRFWSERAFEDVEVIAQSDDGAKASDDAQFLAADWLERGNARTFDEAVLDLLDGIERHYPEDFLMSKDLCSGGVQTFRRQRN